MREGGDDMQKRATGWTRTLGRHGEDMASVHGMHALRTEQLRHPNTLQVLPIARSTVTRALNITLTRLKHFAS